MSEQMIKAIEELTDKKIGPYKPTPAALFPATLDQEFTKLDSLIQVRVSITGEEEEVGENVFTREHFLRLMHHRRCTWEERNRRNRLGENRHVAVEFSGGGDAFEVLMET